MTDEQIKAVTVMLWTFLTEDLHLAPDWQSFQRLKVLVEFIANGLPTDLDQDHDKL